MYMYMYIIHACNWCIILKFRMTVQIISPLSTLHSSPSLPSCLFPLPSLSLSLSISLSRHSKPFNPLLGETYELVNHEGNYCVVTEQVSHHPPVTALHAESDNWVFWEEYKLEIKFRGQVSMWAWLCGRGFA